MALARYLAGITIENRADTVLDPCCGTGTIPKAVYELKRSKGISVKKSLETVWASDKFQFPLQLCTLALAVLTINPDKRLFVARMSKRELIDQRLITFAAKTGVDIDLSHALLNSSLGMFFIESSGFGRGLGALDLNSAKFKDGYCMLNPALLTKKDKVEIVAKFEAIKNRGLKTVLEELSSSDRKEFDKVVLSAFGIANFQKQIANSLIELYSIRQAVH